MEVEELLSELVRIKSINPPGGETAVAEYLKDLFEEYGIPGQVIEPSPGRGNIVAGIGEGKKSLLYLSHTDVVPVSDGWSFPPFSGEIKGGFVHGRGSLDCKGLTAAQAGAMIRLSQRGILGDRLIFVATCDEESGGALGIKYLIENHRHKITADFAVSEGGLEPVEVGGKVLHFVQTGEKGFAWAKLKTRGVSAHSSLPMLGDNAVAKMAGLIKTLTEYQSPFRLIPETRKLTQSVAALGGFAGQTQEQ